MKVEYAYLESPEEPRRPVLAWIRERDELKALVEFRGTTESSFYEVSKFDAGKMPVACFRSMEDAVAFAQ